MCVSPITLPNVSFRKFHRPVDDLPLPEFAGHRPFVRRLLQNTTTQYIQVPCGHCIDCKRKRQSQFVQRSQTAALDHHVVYFTLSISNKFLPTLNFDYYDDNGEIKHFTFKYANVAYVQNMFKRIRKDNAFGRDFKYMLVTEYGGKTHRPHFHGLLFLDIIPDDYCVTGVINPSTTFAIERLVLDTFKKYYSINVSPSTKYPIYETICDFNARPYKGRLPYDVQYVSSVDQLSYGTDHHKNVMYYVTKYAMKDDDFQKTLWKELNYVYHHRVADDTSPIDCFSDYRKKQVFDGDGKIMFGFYWNLLRPKVIMSKFLGMSTQKEIDKIRQDIESSLTLNQSNFTFTDPSSGVLSALSPYYRQRLVTADDVITMLSNINDDAFDNNYDSYRYKVSNYSSEQNEENAMKSRIARGKRIARKIVERDDDLYFDSIECNSFEIDDFGDEVYYFGFSPNEDFDNEAPDYTPDVSKIPKYLLHHLEHSPFNHLLPKEPVVTIHNPYYQSQLF